MTEGEHLRDLLASTETLVVVGASRDPAKDAQAVPARLQRAGWRIIPVNPFATEILGERAYPTLADVAEPVEFVNVFRPSSETPAVARAAIAVGARVLWLQEGIVSPEAKALAEAAGLEYVEDRCVAVIRALYQLTKPPQR